jgi:hypothetical protein
MLFPEIERIDTGPPPYSELQFSYLNRSARPEASRVRERAIRNPWRAGRDSRASFARHALRQRSWLAKKNPNPRKISDLRSSDQPMAA